MKMKILINGGPLLVVITYQCDPREIGVDLRLKT